MTPSNARQVIFYSPTVISYILQRRACFRRPAVDLLGNPNRPPPQIPNPNEETTMTSAGGMCLNHPHHHEGGGHGFLPFASRGILGSRKASFVAIGDDGTGLDLLPKCCLLGLFLARTYIPTPIVVCLSVVPEIVAGKNRCFRCKLLFDLWVLLGVTEDNCLVWLYHLTKGTLLDG